MAPAKTRAAQIQSTNVDDFPKLTGREEEWRFTPLRRLRGLHDGTWKPAEEFPRHQLGVVSEDGLAPLPAGVTASNIKSTDERVGSILTPFDRPSAQAFTQAAESLLVSVAANAVVEQPVIVRLAGGTTEGAVFGHTFIEVGESAEVTIVLDQVGAVTLADNVEISVGPNARVKLVSIADWEADSVQLQHQKARIGRDGSLVHIAVTLGGNLVRQYFSAEFAGPGAEVESYGIYFATGSGAKTGQHFEHRLMVDHAIPDCRSHVTYRGALQGADAHTVWVGDVLIQAAATGTDTYEINRNLILSDGARADSIPNLEIETGEIVGAGHASATGRFDDEQLFYLQARGIPEDDARRLVVRGFFAELINKIGVPELQERLSQSIEDRLAKAGV